MSLVFIIYVVQVLLPAVSVTLDLLCGASAFFMLASTLAHFTHKDDSWKPDYKECCVWVKSKRNWIGVFILGLLANLVPDKETSYVLLAAYGVQEIASNDKVQELGGKSLEVLEKAMNEYLKESETTKEEK